MNLTGAAADLAVQGCFKTYLSLRGAYNQTTKQSLVQCHIREFLPEIASLHFVALAMTNMLILNYAIRRYHRPGNPRRIKNQIKNVLLL